MLQEDYVSFELAKLLKEKGFIGDGEIGCRCGFYEQKTDRPSQINLVYDDLDNSELEKIRKELIEYLGGKRIISNDLEGIDIDKTIAWLEKQGGKRPNDKVEPKFKSGDWVVNDRLKVAVQIKDISYHYNTYTPYGIGCIEFVDENNWHLWTIEDAKDGDVLLSTGFHSDCIFIFDSLDNWKFDEPNGDRAVATGHCCIAISSDKIEFGHGGPDCIEVNSIKPATKEQRGLLFQKMKEARYEWDAEKKELKRIETNSTEWNKEDETECIKLINHFNWNIYDGLTNDERNEAILWLKSIKQRMNGK